MSIGKGNLLAFLVLAGAAGCQPPAPSQAVESEISVLDSKVDYLNLRLNKMEKTIETSARLSEDTEKSSRQGRADLSVAIEDLRTELKTVSGALSVLRHDLDEIGRTHQKVREDFDLRLTEMDQRIAEISRPADRKERSDGETDVARYSRILSLLQKKKSYDHAIGEFREFIGEYPRSPLAANAQYWIGEGYYAKGDYARAISEYQIVVEKYPQGEKLCDALLKQGFAFAEMKEPGKSALFLREVLSRCPKTPSAAKAAERLPKLAPAASGK